MGPWRCLCLWVEIWAGKICMPLKTKHIDALRIIIDLFKSFFSLIDIDHNQWSFSTLYNFSIYISRFWKSDQQDKPYRTLTNQKKENPTIKFVLLRSCVRYHKIWAIRFEPNLSKSMSAFFFQILLNGLTYQININ